MVHVASVEHPGKYVIVFHQIFGGIFAGTY